MSYELMLRLPPKIFEQKFTKAQERDTWKKET